MWAQHITGACRDTGNVELAEYAGSDRAWMKAEDLQQVVEREMPFGRYRGRVIADLPGPYLAWFARFGFPNGEIGRLLELMYQIDHNDLRSLLDPLRRD